MPNFKVPDDLKKLVIEGTKKKWSMVFDLESNHIGIIYDLHVRGGRIKFSRACFTKLVNQFYVLNVMVELDNFNGDIKYYATCKGCCFRDEFPNANGGWFELIGDGTLCAIIGDYRDLVISWTEYFNELKEDDNIIDDFFTRKKNDTILKMQRVDEGQDEAWKKWTE
jgi:hypothetical protein